MSKKQPKKPRIVSSKKKQTKKVVKSSPKRTKLKKAVASAAIRKAVAKRVKKITKKTTSKKTTKTTTKKTKPKVKTIKKRAKTQKSRTKPTSKKTTKKPLLKKHIQKKKTSKKTTSKKTTKTTTKKTKPKVKTTKKTKSVSKPKIKEKKTKATLPTVELNKSEIASLLSDAYARHLLIESGGEHALELVRGFNNNSNDEEMSNKLGIKISDVRATLNKLHSLGIVSYTRHKDSETGWFSYFWTLNVDKMKQWVNARIEEESKKQDFSNGEHYFCPSCGGASIHDFVSASNFGFKCPSCSSALDFLSEDKAKILFPTKVFRKPLL